MHTESVSILAILLTNLHLIMHTDYPFQVKVPGGVKVTPDPVKLEQEASAEVTYTLSKSQK